VRRTQGGIERGERSGAGAGERWRDGAGERSRRGGCLLVVPSLSLDALRSLSLLAVIWRETTLSLDAPPTCGKQAAAQKKTKVENSRALFVCRRRRRSSSFVIVVRERFLSRPSSLCPRRRNPRVSQTADADAPSRSLVGGGQRSEGRSSRKPSLFPLSLLSLLPSLLLPLVLFDPLPLFRFSFPL
jgi:hypothetical protein